MGAGDRAEALHDPSTLGLRPEERGDEDDVALVTLNGLKVPNEELFEGVVAPFSGSDVILDQWVAITLALEALQKKVTLVAVHSNDAERAVRMLNHEADRGSNDRLCLDL